VAELVECANDEQKMETINCTRSMRASVILKPVSHLGASADYIIIH